MAGYLFLEELAICFVLRLSVNQSREGATNLVTQATATIKRFGRAGNSRCEFDISGYLNRLVLAKPMDERVQK